MKRNFGEQALSETKLNIIEKATLKYDCEA